MKVTSARLAKIAGKYLEMDYSHFCAALLARDGSSNVWRETQLLAASVLSQTEPKPKAKRKTAKVKVHK